VSISNLKKYKVTYKFSYNSLPKSRRCYTQFFTDTAPSGIYKVQLLALRANFKLLILWKPIEYRNPAHNAHLAPFEW